ncbi:DNA repair protein RecO C-terminal domain-containing protein [Kocuria rhizophila]|nr:DNA repair protein RecO C-terminal domain-containing protein [Kocuria rhizophila]
MVLRACELGEADRIVILLSAERGSAIAEGARRTAGPVSGPASTVQRGRGAAGPRADPGHRGQAIGKRSYGERIASDYESYTAAAAMAERQRNSPPTTTTPPQHYRLLVGTLSAVARGLHEPGVLDSYLLRAICWRGGRQFRELAPAAVLPAPRSFPPHSAGPCARSAVRAQAAPSDATFQLLTVLLRRGWPAIDAADPRTARAAAGFVATYVQWHMERTVRALALVERAGAWTRRRRTTDR